MANGYDAKACKETRRNLTSTIVSKREDSFLSPNNLKMNIEKFVSLLPIEEKFFLEAFFRCLIQEEPFGYVLLGGKPMSIHSFFRIKPAMQPLSSDPVNSIRLFLDGLNFNDRVFEQGMKIWKKYEPLFCGNNIVMDVNEEDDEGLHWIRITLVNKQLLRSIFSKHLDCFRQLDCSLQDSDHLMQAILHNTELKKRFYSRHDLLGISLGYGVKNAVRFQQICNDLTDLGKLGFTLAKVSNGKREQLEERCQTNKASLSPFKDHTSRKFLFTFGVGFLGDFNEPETLLLQKKYVALRHELTREYLEGDFLKKTLELIVKADCARPERRGSI